MGIVAGVLGTLVMDSLNHLFARTGMLLKIDMRMIGRMSMGWVHGRFRYRSPSEMKQVTNEMLYGYITHYTIGVSLAVPYVLGWDLYLKRINYSGEIRPTIDLLETLHQSQIYTIPFELDQPATQDGLTFRLVGAGNFGTMLQTLTDSQWVDLYSFDLAYVFPNDILYGNHFTSTHPSDFFTFTRVAALPLTNGSITLLNRTLKKKTGDFEQVWELEEGQAYLDALKIHFGIELDAPFEKLRSLPKSD